MSTCANVGPLLDGYHDGELDPFERTRVERHLAACAACRRDLASLRLVGEAVRATVAGVQTPDLWHAIAAELPAERRRHRSATPVLRRRAAAGRRRWIPAAAAVAAGVLLYAVTLTEPEDLGPSGVVRSIYAPERPVIVLEAEKKGDPTIIWLMDEDGAEAVPHVRI